MFIQKLIFREESGEQIGPLNLNEDLNIIFGLNAAGKTRTLNVLFNLGRLHKATKIFVHGYWNLEIKKDTKTYLYELRIKNTPEGNIVEQDSLYSEEGGNRTLIFDRMKGKLLDESSGNLDTYSPLAYEFSLNYVKDTVKHKTAIEIKEYLTGFKRLDYSMGKVLQPHDQNTLMVEPDGTRLDTAILNIMRKYPQDFEKIKNYFIEMYPQVQNITIDVLHVGNMLVETIFFKENNLIGPYIYFEAASGMIKSLALLTILFSPLKKSLILIDELENSLDYDRLVKIGEVIEQVSFEKQIIIVTHSPLFADIFELKNWIIAKREGNGTKFFNILPDENLKLFIEKKLNNFSLYTQDLLNLSEQK